MDFQFDEDDSLSLDHLLGSSTQQTNNKRLDANNNPTNPLGVPDPLSSTTTTISIPRAIPSASGQQKIKLGKGLLSTLKHKEVARNEMVSATDVSEQLLLAQQAQSDLTQVDRLIQQQFINTTMGLEVQNNDDDKNDKKKKNKEQNKSKSQQRWKLDWDANEDYTVDQFSLQSGAMASLMEDRDYYGNVKRQKNNNNQIINKNNNNQIINKNNNNEIMDDSQQPSSTSSRPPSLPSTKLVILGMDDETEQIIDTTQVDLHGNNLNKGSAGFNLIKNSLNGGDLTKLQTQHLLNPLSRSNAGIIDPSLLPRNRNHLKDADLRPWNEKTLEEMTVRDWTILKEDFQMITRGTNIPNPLRYWSDLNLYDVPMGIMDAISEIGYAHPTGIQRIAMPTSLLNRDIIARAQTGSGKTCSFLVPVLTYIAKQPALDARTCLEGPYGIILAPARELATQIYDEALKLTRFMSNSINIALVIGGKKEYSLQDRIELVVATPGRLDDLLEQRELVLNQCRYIILDEADKMLDEGFEPQVNRILDAMPSSSQQQLQNRQNQSSIQNQSQYLLTNLYQDKRRRTMLYSATFSKKIEELAAKYMASDYVKVEVGDQEHKINKSITQVIEWCHPSTEDQKLSIVCSYLNQFLPSQYKVIIFCARKENCDNLCYRLGEASRRSNSGQNRRHYLAVPARPIVLHGDALDREANLRGFKEGEYNVLIATDVAGRGIDVKDVKLVINYELPDNKVLVTALNANNPNIYNSIFEAYTHRVGRTGRAGQTGTAVTLITDKEKAMIPLFKAFLVKNGVKSFPKQFNDLSEGGNDNRPILL